jgi:hypothetical protein
MRMYVGNCSQQVQDFYYRVPEEAQGRSSGLRMQKIDVGSQVIISGNLSTPQIESIVAQHAPYGLIRVDEIDRTRPYIGLCYDVDRPIPVNKLKYAIEHNREVLIKRGEEIRKETAVAVNQQLEEVAPGLTKSEFTLQEEKTGTGPEHEPLNEALRVTRYEGGPPPEAPRRKQRGR